MDYRIFIDVAIDYRKDKKMYIGIYKDNSFIQITKKEYDAFEYKEGGE